MQSTARTRTLVSLAAAACCMAAAAPSQAALVQWTFEGNFANIDSWPNLPAAVAAGLPFTLKVSFDSDAALKNKVLDADGAGYRYNFNNSSVAMTLDAGPVHAVFGNEVQLNVILRDNFADPGNAARQVDGITLSMIDEFDNNFNGTATDFRTVLTLRSTDLAGWTITNDKLPTTPFTATGLTSNQLSLCRFAHGDTTQACTFGFIDGLVSPAAAAVPEPAGFGLLGLSLGALALSRRRAGAGRAA